MRELTMSQPTMSQPTRPQPTRPQPTVPDPTRRCAFRSCPRAGVALIAVALGALWGPARAAGAQSAAAYTQTFADYVDNRTGSERYVCGSTTTLQPGPGSMGGGCDAQGASFAYSASTSAGLLRGYASVLGSALPALPDGGAWSASASSSWGDRLAITGGTASTLALTIAWDGRLAASVADQVRATGFSEASANWLFQAFFDGYQLAGYTSGARVEARTDVDPSQMLYANDSHTVLIPILGVPALDFDFSLSTGAGLRSWDNNGAGAGTTFDGSATADFGHTGEITGLTFLDAAGHDVTGLEQYHFLGGTQVYPTTTTPEPGTPALVGAGLLALTAAARRRRRATATSRSRGWEHAAWLPGSPGRDVVR